MSDVGRKPPPARNVRAKSTGVSQPATTSTSTNHKAKNYDRGSQLPPRAKSTSCKPSKPQTRTLRTTQNGRPIQKTQSDTSLAFSAKPASTNSSSRSLLLRRNSSAGVIRACQNMEDVAQQIISKQAKNVVVMAGAGISTASGIPDFRSPGTGLYDNLKQYRIPHPQAIFDLEYFEGNPRPFFTLAKELYPGKFLPNLTHYFLRLLHEKGILLRVYTQNIDGLERRAGIPANKLVEAHGSFLTASCIKCCTSHPPDDVKQVIFSDKIPRCRKNGCLGLIKPDIVFFGEDLPRKFYFYLKDFPQADLLIVMGTSLEVEPFASIVDSVRRYVPRILFNRVPVGPFSPKRRMNDVTATGDLARNISEFVKILGWEDDLKALIEQHDKWLKENETLSNDKPPLSSGLPALDQAFSRLSVGLNHSSHNNNIDIRSSQLHRPTFSNCRTLSNFGESHHRAKQEINSMKDQIRLGHERRAASPAKSEPPARSRTKVADCRPHHRLTSFHAQHHLYRTNTKDSSSEYSDSSSNTTSSDED